MRRIIQYRCFFPIILSTSIWLLPSIRSPSCKQRLWPITGQDFRWQNLWFSITFENFSCRPIFVGRQKSADFFMTHDRYCRPTISADFYLPCVMGFTLLASIKTLRHQDSSAPVRNDRETVRHQKKFGAEVSGHFGISCLVPNCLGAEVSWCRSVLTPADMTL